MIIALVGAGCLLLGFYAGARFVGVAYRYDRADIRPAQRRRS